MTSPISVSVRIDRLHRNKATELNGGVENKATEDGSRCGKLSEDDSRARYRVDSGRTGSALIGGHVTGNGRPRRRMDYDTDIIDGFLIASFDTIDELQLYADGCDTSPPSTDSAASVAKDQTPISTPKNKPDVELRCFEYDDEEDDGEKTEEEDDPSVSRVDSGFEDVPDVDLCRPASQEPYIVNDPIVTNKFASPRPLIGVPHPTSGVAVAASVQRGGGGSACESVSPTRAQVPLDQSSEPRLLPSNGGIANPDPLPGCCHPASSIPVLPTSSAADSFSGSRSQNEDVSRRRVMGASSSISSVSGRPLKRRRDSGNAESPARGTKRRYIVTEDDDDDDDEDIDDDGCRFSRDVSTDENFNVATQRPVCTTTVSPSRERKYADDVVVTSSWDAPIVIESLASSPTVFGAKGPDVPRPLSPLSRSQTSVDEKSSSLLAATAAVTTTQMGDSEIVLSVGVFESSSFSSNGCGEAPETAERCDVVDGDGCVRSPLLDRRKIDTQAPVLTGSQANRPVCGKIKVEVDYSYPLPSVHCGTTSQPEVINGHGGSLVSTAAAVSSSTSQNSSLSVSDIQSNHHPVFQTAVSTPTSNFVSPLPSRHSSVTRQRPLVTSSVSASVNSTNQHSSTASHQASTPSTQLHRWPPFHTPHLPSSSSSTASHLLPGQRPTFRFPSPVSTSCSVPFSSPFSHRDDAIRSLFSGATGYGMFLPPSLHGFPPPPAPPLLQQLQSITAAGHFAQSQPQSAEAVTRSAGTPAMAHSATMLNLASPANVMTNLSDVAVDGRVQRHLASNHSELMTRLQQELNTRFLQDRGLLPPPSGTSAAGALLSPFTLHTEMHQHLHHHQHHMMPSSGLYLPLPNVPPTASDQKAPPDGASLLAVAERELAAKVSGLFPSLGATVHAPKLPTVFGPAGNNGVNGAFQPKAGPLSQTMTPASQLLLALRDRDQTALNTQYPPATIRKPGKWCSAHVRTAWNIQFRKQRNAAERHGTANGQSAVDMRRPIPPSSNGMAAPLNLSGLTSEAANGPIGSRNLSTPSNISRPLNVWNGTIREESPQQRFGKCNNSRLDKESGMVPDRKQLRAAELTDKVKAEHGDKAKERLLTGRPPGMSGLNEVTDRRSHSRHRSRSRSPRSDAPRSSSTGGGIGGKNHRSSASRDHPKTHSDADPDILHVGAPTRSQHCTPSIDLAIASLLGGGPSAIFPPFPLFPPPDLRRPQFTPTSSGLIPTSAGNSFSAAAAAHRSNGALSADSLLGPLAAFAAAAADARLTTDSLRLAATTNAHMFPSAHNPMSLLFPPMLPLGPPYQPSASVGLSQLSSSPISRFTDLKSPTLIGRAGSPASALSSRVNKQRQSFNGGPVDCLTNSTGETRSNGFSSAATNGNAKLPPPLL